MSNPIDDFLFGGGARSAFPADAPIGTTVAGTITGFEMKQQTDKDNNPRFFTSGDPMMMLLVTVQTDERLEDEDDGIRTLYAKGGRGDTFKATVGDGASMKDAIADAIKTAGAKSLAVGARLVVKRTGQGKRSGLNSAPWLYRAAYKAPELGLDALAGTAAPVAAPAPVAPAPAPAPAAPAQSSLDDLNALV